MTKLPSFRDLSWQDLESPSSTFLVNHIRKELGLSKVVAELLTIRQLEKLEEIEAFLYPRFEHCSDPFLLADMEIAVERILKALSQGETLVVYGDYDVDGTAGAVILYRYLKRIGLRAHYFIPERLKDGYGLTETHGIVTANAAKFFIEKPASCGRAVPVCDVKLVDDDGNDVAITPEARGQLCVRGPIVVKGYINRPDATADAIRDGWFNTGDVAMVDDDGFIYIVDRAKDMVLRGGENVYSAEVEAAIYQNEAVAEAAVFGVPDDRLGEEVGVAIHLHPSASLSAEALPEFLGERIAKHKVPRYLWILDEKLPQNANGKFLKRELKERLIPTL